jgi:hypothetical protein
MLGSIGDRPAADQPMPPVDADMALVAEDGDGDLDGLALRAFWFGLGPAAFERPAGIPVLLRALGAGPTLRRAAVADDGLLFNSEFLARRGDQVGIDDLPAMAR